MDADAQAAGGGGGGGGRDGPGAAQDARGHEEARLGDDARLVLVSTRPPGAASGAELHHVMVRMGWDGMGSLVKSVSLSSYR